MWSLYLRPSFAQEAGCLIVRNRVDGEWVFDFPVPGPGGDVDAALTAIEEYCTETGTPPVISVVPEEKAPELLLRWPRFRLTNERNWKDYLYRAEDMAAFAGRKYSGQRNHINKFRKEYPNARFVVLTGEDMPLIEDFWGDYEQEFQKTSFNAKRELAYAKALARLLPEGWLLEFFSLLVPVKLGFAGMFFAIFLKKLFGKNDASIAVFGGFYGLCAWALGYQWNVMWLDTFALLPLVALGTVCLLKEKKFFLYTITLFLSVYSNYYIGFFTCIFVFLLFFVYEICRWGGWKKLAADFGRIALFSVLALGMTAILTFPALSALQTTQSSVNNFPTGFRLNIAKENTIKGLLDAMRQVAGNMGGSIEPTFKEGLPNLYCGIFSILLMFLYLMAKDVKRRDKCCAVILLLFFNVSFIIRQLDFIWHGFHFTNMIPYRFSFLYSFVVLYMAYRAWLMRRKFRPVQIVIAGALTAGVLACSNELFETVPLELGSLTLQIPLYFIYNLIFLVLYLTVMLYGQLEVPEGDTERQKIRARAKRNRQRARIRILALSVMGVELIATLICFGLYFTGTGVSNYPKGTTYTASVIRYMYEREDDNLFFRAETTHSQTLNDGALNGYNGISAFTSSANVRVTEFMRALGYGAKNTYNRYCFEESSPVANLFLGIKYMIERDGKDKSSTYFDEVNLSLIHI